MYYAGEAVCLYCLDPGLCPFSRSLSLVGEGGHDYSHNLPNITLACYIDDIMLIGSGWQEIIKHPIHLNKTYPCQLVESKSISHAYPLGGVSGV